MADVYFRSTGGISIGAPSGTASADAEEAARSGGTITLEVASVVDIEDPEAVASNDFIVGDTTAPTGWVRKSRTDTLTILGFDTDGALSANSDSKFPSQKAAKTYADGKMPASYLDTDGALTANSDVKVASQKATKTYADGKIPKAGNVTAITDTGIADGEIAVFNLTNKDIRTSNAVISTDGTLASNADTNIPTEKAVKTYADLKLAKASNLSDVASASTARANLGIQAKYISDYADLATAITAIGSTSCTLVIDANATVAADLSFPATLFVCVLRGATITIATGKTLTVNGGFRAGPYKIFYCAGTGKVQFGVAFSVYPEWWGAAGDGTTNDLAALNAALASAAASGGGLTFQAGRTYAIQDGYVVVTNGVREIDGNGATVKALASTSSVGILLKGVHFGAASNVKYLHLHDLTIDLNGQAGVGIYGDANSYCNIHHNRVLNVKDATSVHGIIIYVFLDSGENAVENRIADNLIKLNGVQDSATGISLWAEHDYTPHADGTAYWKAVGSVKTATYIPARTVVQGNTITGGYYGISLHGAYFSTVAGNVSAGNVRAISVQNNSKGNTISENILQNMTSSAIHLAFGSSYNTISANVIYTVAAEGEGLLQAYIACAWNVFSGNVLLATVKAPKYFLYCAVESGGNIFSGNTLMGLAAKAYIAVESDWYGGASVTNAAHRAYGLGDAYKDYAHANMGVVRITHNAINNQSNVPAIFLSQITTDTKSYTLTDIVVAGNQVVNNSTSYQLEIYEMTGVISNTALTGNVWPSDAAAADFKLARGRAHFRECSGNSPAFVEGVSGKVSSTASVTLSGASGSIAVNVPSGARILGVQLRVDTAITSGDGATSWAAAYVNTPTTAICSGKAFAKNTKHSAIHGAHEITTGVATITITPNSGTFSGGVVTGTVYYETVESMLDVA